MSNRKFTGARPVRFESGKGWIECEPYRAQRWQAVLFDRVLTSAPYCRSKRFAEDLVATNVLRHRPLPRQYSLGKPMGKRPAKLGQPIVLICNKEA
jgi:hypothetical protein